MPNILSIKALRTKKQVEILTLALAIYNDVERRSDISIFGKNTGLCICVKYAVKEITKLDVKFDVLHVLIPRFNFNTLKAKGLAGILPKMRIGANSDGFWWNEYDWSIRPIVLQYLIDSYKK